jgi:tetratricopeptide (TPR) repeat protein
MMVADTGAQGEVWRLCLTDTSIQAIEACTAIIILDPEDDGAYVNRGIAYRRLGEHRKAIADYEHALRLNPKAADAFNNRGNAYRALDDLDRALTDYDEAIRLNPSYAHAYNNRGVIFLEIGNTERAVADFDRAIAEDASYANAFRNRGVARTHLQLFELAIDDFDSSTRLDPAIPHGPEYAVALYGRGVVRQERGHPGGAADIERARHLVPNVAELADLSRD